MLDNYFVSKELRCTCRWNDEFQVLEWAPMDGDSQANSEDFGAVQEDMVGEEIVTFDGREQRLAAVFLSIERQLGAPARRSA